MVLCKYYIQNSCWYGSKCNYEHLDIKYIIKVDILQSVYGKQWRLSSYGPFGNKPCLPMFREDQSFEEMRKLYYDAKQNNLRQYREQFSRKATKAIMEMKSLLRFTPDIIQMVCDIYNNNNAVKTKTSAAGKNKIFGFNSITAKQQNDNDANNIYTMQNISDNTVGNMKRSSSAIFRKRAKEKFSFGNLQTASLLSQEKFDMQKQSRKTNFFIQTINNQENELPDEIFDQSPQNTQNIFKQNCNSINKQLQQQQKKSIFGQNIQQSGNKFTFGASDTSKEFNSNSPSVFSKQFSEYATQIQLPIPIFKDEMQTTLTAYNDTMQTMQSTQKSAMQNCIQEVQQVASQLQQLQQEDSTDASTIIPVTQLYTPLAMLNTEELEAFKAEAFTLGKVPTKPPPRELC